MTTALLILVALLLAAGIACTLIGLARGCPFAWMSVMFGGLGTMVEALGEILKGLSE